MQGGIIQGIERIAISRRNSFRSTVSVSPPAEAALGGDECHMDMEEETYSLAAEYVSSLPADEANALMMDAPPHVRVRS